MTAVLVVAKAPVAGLAKTRLCPPATLRQAATLAAAALLDTLAAVRATPGVTPVLAYTGALDDAELSTELRAALAGWRLIAQRGTGLGERLAHAHGDAAAVTGGGPVVQIGMDTPQVTPAALAAVVALLSDVDAVLGPATDGGWWLLGLHAAAHARMLASVPMSTPDTGRLTRAALSGRGLRIGDAPTLTDVDTWRDAVAVAGAAPDGRFAAAVADCAVAMPR